MSSEFLRQSPLFAGLAREDLDRLLAGARHLNLAPGETLIVEGEAAGAAFLVVDGTFDVTRHSGDREFVIDRRGAGELIGEAALLENASRTASVRAATAAQVLEITRETFQALVTRSPVASLAALQTIAARLRHSEVMLRHSEKMVALGTLSAGLAHELNNPAAAVQRSAGQLEGAIAGLQAGARELTRAGLSADQIALLDDLQARLPARLAAGDPRGALARERGEDALREWLDGLGVADAWAIAPEVAAAGLSVAELHALASGFTSPQQAAFARWLASAVLVHALLRELDQGAGRIAEIVAGVKSYAFLDRAPIQLVDIHEGLEDTLVILRHKLEPGVQVVREYDGSLPRIEAYGSELNQVWTNLLDNAADAVAGRGMIRIKTYAGKCTDGAPSVVVEIRDTGPGIPQETQERIFDAFFTTKPPGQGAGLGLHIAYTVVVNRHHGDIAVQSQEGETSFRVTLPIQQTQD